MADPRFSIGIDLGTTNSAMAYTPLATDEPSEVFAIPQRDSLATVAEFPTLPSFLYLPDDSSTGARQDKGSEVAAWIVGRFARKQACDAPGRVAHSAKSWLCHHATDREASFLPWGSEDVPAAHKISPVRAAALILAHLRQSWNDRFAAMGADYAFDAQDITVTVPASFDAAAQRLTLAAAEQAGFPGTVRLLEEPQAAFYRWLEEHNGGLEFWSRLPAPQEQGNHILVVDVGGGTSDFSLFAVRPAGHAMPAITRLAVSDHILLGGDNIDLAIAHLAEPRLVEQFGKLSGAPWDYLVARCRDLKERALSTAGSPDEAFTLSIPGRGSSLMASASSAQVTRAEIDSVVLEGFFPECSADARVARTSAALKELGLPYAVDSAVTRHLAAFLKGRPRIDAVLFNGGSLYPAPLRERICREIGKWQGGEAPLGLVCANPELAVARGAARFGKLRFRKAAQIEAGAARAVFLEVHGKSAKEGERKPAPSLVCVLPRGSAAEETFEITNLALELRINRPVRFQAYSSSRRGRCKAGDVIPLDEDEFQALPPLQTVAKLKKASEGDPGRKIPVTLTASLNELGLLQVSCRSADPQIRQSWPLDFNLRPHERNDGDVPGAEEASSRPVETGPNVPPKVLEAARERIAGLLAKPLNPRDKLSATRVLSILEKVFEMPKADWNGTLVRALWSTMEACAPHRGLSVEHEETWLILAGFLLRPGFGAAADEARIDSLWRVREGGLRFPNKRVKIQEYILWRRVAGGLSHERQEAILAAEFDKLRQQKSPAPELIRLAGSLERIDQETKAALIGQFIETAANLARQGGHCAPYLAALGFLLNRCPLYAGQETVVPSKLVEQAYDAFSGLDWKAPELSELQTLFLRAARVVDNRSLDLPQSLRSRIASKLEKAGITPSKTAKLRDFIPVPASERLGLFGESLPPGLILSEDPGA